MNTNALMPEEAVITAIKKQTYDTITYTMEFKNKARQKDYRFLPGQFNMLSLWGLGEAPISISSSPWNGETFDHTVRAVGDITHAMTRMEPGQTIGVRGPYGNGWPVEEAEGKDVLIVAGGIGLAPLRPFIVHLFENRRDYGSLEILYGARTPDDLLFTDEFDLWTQNYRTQILLSVDKVGDRTDWAHNVGVVTTLFDKMRTRPGNAIVLMCGPEVMMKFSIFSILGIGYRPDEIYVSLERRMKCGVAVCGHCQIGPHFVCKCGPVFPYSTVQSIFGAS